MNIVDSFYFNEEKFDFDGDIVVVDGYALYTINNGLASVLGGDYTMRTADDDSPNKELVAKTRVAMANYITNF